jgi:hypothetical protein
MRHEIIILGCFENYSHGYFILIFYFLDSIFRMRSVLRTLWFVVLDTKHSYNRE